ncbi:MAG: divalent-cation tolerance protein CutA [Candidatus Sericytochromatia bacterium]
MSAHCVVYVTTASEAEAQHLAEILVKERLVACVNRVGPMTSTYLWEGELQQENEYLLILKTRVARLPALTDRITTLHSYSVPEVVALPILGGSAAYLNWVSQSTEEIPHD